MPQSSSERGVARSLFISCDTIDTFLATATPGQLSACTSMLEGELAHRERLLILDEFGYVPFDVDGARLLFQVISESYERRSIIFTTNIEFSR